MCMRVPALFYILEESAFALYSNSPLNIDTLIFPFQIGLAKALE